MPEPGSSPPPRNRAAPSPRPVWIAALSLGSLYGLLVLLTADHYGVGWDNPIHFKAARLRLDYVLGEGRDLLRFGNLRYYGPLTDLLSLGSYHLFHRTLGWLREIPARHLHLYAFGGLTVGTTTWIGARLRGLSIGLLAGLLLSLHPVYLGFTHLAMKGIPVGFFYLLAAYLGYRWTERDEWKSFYGACVAVGLGLACKLSIVGVVFALAAYRLVRWRERPLPVEGPTVRRMILGGLAGWGAAVAVWPYLWFNPLRLFEPFLYFLGRYDWEFKLLYMGTRWDLAVESVPWHYPPVTLLIKSSLVHLAGLAAGLAWYRPGRRGERSPILWLHAMILVPLAITLFFDSFYYDADRQYLFLYPPVALASALGWEAILRRWRRVGAGLLAAGMIYLGARIVRLHPHEAVFYNDLVGRETGAVGRYELDYYGNVYRQGCRWLNRHAEPDDVVHVPLMGNLALYCLRDDLGMNEYSADNADWAMILPRAGINPLAGEKPAAVIPSRELPLLYIYRMEAALRDRDYHRFFR